MARRDGALLTLALVAALAGCGGSSGGGAKVADTPKAVVEGFSANVKAGDWKAACVPLTPGGGVGLINGLRIPQAELDDFGLLKNCPATLAGHSAAVRALVAGGPPGAVGPLRGDTVTIASPHGNWTVVRQNHTDASHRWVIEQTPDPPSGP